MKLEEFCKDGLEQYAATLEVELNKVNDTFRCKNDNLTNRVESMHTKSKRDIDQIHNRLKNDYITKIKTDELVNTTVTFNSNQLHSRI